MTAAIILAGGEGHRVGAEMPKQFVEINSKPLFAYATEQIQNHALIDFYIIVAKQTYHGLIKDYVERYGFTKFRKVVDAGVTCNESIANGVDSLKGLLKQDDLVHITLAITPFISEDIIADSINVCISKGNAVAATKPLFNITVTQQDTVCTNEFIYKTKYVTLNFPFTFQFGNLTKLYEVFRKDNICDSEFDYTYTLAVALGEKIHFSKSTKKSSFKLTDSVDFDMFKTYTNNKEENYT